MLWQSSGVNMPLKPIKTPCVGICKMGEGVDLCLGCGRRMNEIMGWSWYSDESRDRIMIECANRLFDLLDKKGGDG
jgi:uncharacterized protein